MKYLIIYLILINAVSFTLMLLDKYKAKRNLWRIPERILLTLAAFGGSIGTLIGMYLIRHKTRHQRFVIGVPLILTVQLIGGFWLYHCFSS